jgi:arylformamidase
VTTRGDWGTLSRAERDASYNNSAACPGGAAYSEALRDASAAFRQRAGAKLDVRYGPTDRTAWDLFPAADKAAPCFVFIHGGYWQRGSRDSPSALVEAIMTHGWSAALPGYTLAPDATLTQIVGEIMAALDWLAAEGPSHGIAGGPVVVSGWSAGGHLTAMAAAHKRVTAAMPMSGVFELGPIRDTYLNEKLALTDAEIETLSPLRLPVVRKPMAIAYGTKELPPLVGDSRALHARRAAAHMPGPLVPVAGADHFSILNELRRPHGLLVRHAMDLLK